jgi:hypothetical protein
MRQRRAAKLIERAQRALDEGQLEQAEAALSEARELAQDSPELELLDANLASRRPTALALPPDLPLSDIDVSESSRRSSARWWSIAAAAVVVIAGGGLAYARYWNAPPPERAPAATAAAPVVPLATSVTPQVERTDRLTIVRETITAQTVTPRLAEDELPRLPPYPAPPIAAPSPEPDPVVMAVNRGDAGPPASTTVAPPASVQVELPASSATPPPPLRAFIPDTSPSNALRPEAPPARIETPAPGAREAAPPAAEPAVRDETVVRSVLGRYEAAYSNLDATAASAVWPAVDRSALARAFDGLASQHVSLGNCDIAVTGSSARATCAGSATWRPKVGGGSHTESRRWNFELRKAGDSWRIEKAVIR